MEYVSTQIFMRYYSKQVINNYQIHSWTLNAILVTFEANQIYKFSFKSGCPILHASKFNKQYS